MCFKPKLPIHHQRAILTERKKSFITAKPKRCRMKEKLSTSQMKGPFQGLSNFEDLLKIPRMEAFIKEYNIDITPLFIQFSQPSKLVYKITCIPWDTYIKMLSEKNETSTLKKQSSGLFWCNSCQCCALSAPVTSREHYESCLFLKWKQNQSLCKFASIVV